MPLTVIQYRNISIQEYIWVKRRIRVAEKIFFFFFLGGGGGGGGEIFGSKVPSRYIQHRVNSRRGIAGLSCNHL